MGTAAAIISILAALTPFILKAITDHQKKEADPNEQSRERKEQIAKEIIQRDGEAINRSLDAGLERLRQLQGDKQRSNGGPAKTRPILYPFM
jgi:hypothetical protein